MLSGQGGNLSGSERTWSAVLGTALSLLVFRRGSPLLRSLAAAAGAMFVARAVAGHCAVKAAITGESSIGEGLRDQWSRLAGGRGDSFSSQEYVEELADPVGVQEGARSSQSAASAAYGARH